MEIDKEVRMRYTSQGIRFPIGESRDVPPGVSQHWVILVPKLDGKGMELELVLIRFEAVPVSAPIRERAQ